MAYTVKNYVCPSDTHIGFLPGTSQEAETLVLQVFRAAWLANDLKRPYVCLAAHLEAENLGWLEIVRLPSTFRLTERALDRLHTVYGR